MIHSGRRRHLVEIQRAVSARTPHGGVKETWEPLATAWVAIEPMDAKEVFASQQVGGQVSHRVRMLYFGGLEPTDRFRLGSRIFNISGILNVKERNRELEVLCMEAT